MFACLFETNFPNIPFLKPTLFSFRQFPFFFCCSCFVFMVYVSAFMSLCWLCFGILCFCSVFWFLFCFLFCLQSMKKFFFLQFWCFLVMSVKRVVWFLCFMFLFLFVVLVLLVSILKRIHLYYFVSVLLLVSQDYVVFLFASCGPSSFLFLLFCFEFVFLLFFIPLKKDPQKNRTQQKPKKANMQKKADKKEIS